MSLVRWAWLAVLISSATFGVNAHARSAQQQKAGLPFINYLRSPSSALIAFSPTNHDPRPGSDYRAPGQESLSADLTSLRPAFDGLILYGYDRNVTPAVLSEMRRLKYRAVMLGIWDPKSREEVLTIADLAAGYSGSLAVAVCVGNEGLAFNRYGFDDIVQAAALVEKRIGRAKGVAICTSEPFSEYGWAPLRGFGDFLAPNIHPVFDRPTLGPAEAVAWVRERALALAETARKPLLVKETGFPHGERFTPSLQAEFWTDYIRSGAVVESRASRDVWVSLAAAFEAFDLPWKAEQSGMPIEKSWGLMSTARTPYPAFFVWETRHGKRSPK